jgi:hypothetical protein
MKELSSLSMTVGKISNYFRKCLTTLKNTLAYFYFGPPFATKKSV